MSTLTDEIVAKLKDAADESLIPVLEYFFKTGKGQYGEGDVFIGLKNPQTRAFAKEYRAIPLADVVSLLKNPIHQVRLLALLIMAWQYKKGTEEKKSEILQLYLDNTKYINNWDLVDLSAPDIVGCELLRGKRDFLPRLVNSGFLWEERIAVISTITLVRHGEFGLTIELVKVFMNHPHDLIHKVCGWVLREIGKKDRRVLTDFLNEYKLNLPRTTLRYAIEHYPQEERKVFLTK